MRTKNKISSCTIALCLEGMQYFLGRPKKFARPSTILFITPPPSGGGVISRLGKSSPGRPSKHKAIVQPLISFIFLFLIACGSGSPKTPEPELSESLPVSKTVVFQPEWPDVLASVVSSLELQGFLKGKTDTGKSVGSLGPVIAAQNGSGYTFTFDAVPQELSKKAMFSVDIFQSNAALPDRCLKIAVLNKELSLEANEISLSVSPSDFQITFDCDGDGVSDAQDVFPLDASESVDQDGDTIGDNSDNCVEVTNPDQGDIDLDGLGNVCDPQDDTDTDGDGVPDVLDAFPANASQWQDSDSDGVAEPLDNCPLVANADQLNSDQDPEGDLCDCEPNLNTVYSSAVDEPDSNYFDSNCDGIDGNRAKAILVDGETITLTEALGRASAEEKDIYVAAGNYFVDSLAIPDGVRLFGGYKIGGPEEPFALRRVNSSDPDFVTLLKSQQSDVTLTIQNNIEEILLDGFTIVNDQIETDEDIGSRTLLVQNGKARFTNNIIQGSTRGRRTTAVAILGDSEVTLEKNWIDGGNGLDASLGLLISTADAVTVIDNVIRAGSGSFATGVDIQGASPSVRNNTIDGTSRFMTLSVSTTQAIFFENALGLELKNNILITAVAANQYVVTCVGLEPTDPTKVTSNLFVVLPGSVTVPRSVSCLGGFDFSAADGLELGFQTALGNFDFDGNSLAALLDETTYRVLDVRYQNLGAQR